MNPLILRGDEQLADAQATMCKHSDNSWWPGIPLHRWIHRLRAALLVLRGEAFVLDVADRGSVEVKPSTPWPITAHPSKGGVNRVFQSNKRPPPPARQVLE